jgi:hypothetical protein
MVSDRQCVISFLLILGALAFAGGILVRIGKLRHWFLMPTYPVLMPKAAVYAQLPLGLMLIGMAASLFMPTPEVARGVWLWTVFPLFAIALVLAIWQPAWLKPRWVRWLEEKQSDILDLLLEEGRQTPDWASKVSTQEDLEQWVAEVRRKPGWRSTEVTDRD